MSRSRGKRGARAERLHDLNQDVTIPAASRRFCMPAVNVQLGKYVRYVKVNSPGQRSTARQTNTNRGITQLKPLKASHTLCVPPPTANRHHPQKSCLDWTITNARSPASNHYGPGKMPSSAPTIFPLKPTEALQFLGQPTDGVVGPCNPATASLPPANQEGPGYTLVPFTQFLFDFITLCDI